ncbi:MAG: SDR family NAD(P)-dependent oxidoreductase, partial [Pseudolabrys sp.]
HVTLAARTTSEIEEAAAAIRARGRKAERLTLDVTDNNAVQTALKGKIFDVLVNNAGTNRPGPFIEVTEENYDLIFDLDMRACFFVAQAVVRELIAAKRTGLDHQCYIAARPCRLGRAHDLCLGKTRP